MTIDPYIILGAAIVGFLVGMTGAGGGALMTPMLILLFGIKPSTAISSDLVAAVLMRPLGAGVHLRQGTVNLRLVRWLVLGSAPMAFLGAYLLSLMGHSSEAQQNIERALGVALLAGAGAMVLRYLLDRRTGERRTTVVHAIVPRPLGHGRDRDDRRARGRPDVRRLGLADDRHAAVPLSDHRRQPARRHGPDAGGAARRRRSARRARLRPRPVRRDRVACDRQRPGRVRGIAAVVHRPRSLRATRHHVRDRRVRPEVCGRRRDGAWVDSVRDPPRQLRVVAGGEEPWRKGRPAVDLAQSEADALAQSEADALAVEERIWPAG